MRKIASYGCMLVLMSVLLVSCEKTNEEAVNNIDDLSLAEAIDLGALNIDKAVESIEKTNAYKLFVSESGIKSAEEYDLPAINIYLDDLKGVYEYAPVEQEEDEQARLKQGCKTFFQRIDDSELFIIHLPFDKVKKPKQLFNYNPEEEFVNDLMISTSEFIFESKKAMFQHNYHMATRFDVEEEYAGHLWVDEERYGLFNTVASSKFGFTDEHFIKVMTQLGDTIMVSYCLENADEEKLYSELVSFSMNMVDGNPNLQFSYEIQVGDVRIVKTLDEENELVYVVYKGDELREDAIVNVIVSDGEAPTSVNCLFMNKNKDLQITLSDEPPILLSDLIGDSQDVLADLFGSMKELYLSKMVINRLAWQIYSEQDCDEEGEDD